jgi:glycosyltransferase involved in cell wall biosynthesis
VGGVLDIVEQNETGFIIPRMNKSEFVSKLLLLTENDEIRRKMKEKGWQNVYEKYSYQRLAKDMDSYYKELLNR